MGIRKLARAYGTNPGPGDKPGQRQNVGESRTAHFADGGDVAGNVDTQVPHPLLPPSQAVSETHDGLEAARNYHRRLAGVALAHPGIGLSVWNSHANDLGDHCPWSGQQATRQNREALMSGVTDDRCPQGCQESGLEDPPQGSYLYRAAANAQGEAGPGGYSMQDDRIADRERDD